MNDETKIDRILAARHQTRSVTRWLYHFSLFGYLSQFEFAQNLHKNCQRRLRRPKSL